MAQNFVYRARNNQGKIIKGKITAESAGAATAMLRQQSIFVLDIKAGKPDKGSKSGGKAPGLQLELFEPKVTTKDLAIFCRQFATMITCGVPIIQCLNILSQQTDNKKLVRTIASMVDRLEKGQSLADTARAYPGVFPHIFTSMLEAGEISGSLDTVMERLATHFEKENDLREKVKSAMTYPAVVAVVAVVAVAALMMFVIPTFVDMLTQFNAELPLMTKIVMDTSTFMRNYWYILFALLAVSGFVYRRFTATKQGRAVMDRLSLRLPVFGNLIRRLIISRFARTLSTLLASGVPLLQAFGVVKNVVGNALVEEAIMGAVESVKEGQSIAPPLQQSGVFPPMVTRMIAIGEETGSLDTMLERLAQFYDREVEDIVSRLSSMIEPVLIVGMGGVVGFIILSIMLPMFSIMSSVN